MGHFPLSSIISRRLAAVSSHSHGPIVPSAVSRKTASSSCVGVLYFYCTEFGRDESGESRKFDKAKGSLHRQGAFRA